MQYLVVWSDGVNKRSAPTTSSTVRGTYAFGVKVEVLRDNIPDQTFPTDPSKKWVEFTDHTFGASIYGAGSVRMEKVDEPTPTPEPGLQPLQVTVSGEGYQTITVELRPL